MTAQRCVQLHLLSSEGPALGPQNAAALGRSRGSGSQKDMLLLELYEGSQQVWLSEEPSTVHQPSLQSLQARTHPAE